MSKDSIVIPLKISGLKNLKKIYAMKDKKKRIEKLADFYEVIIHSVEILVKEKLEL